jgi:hypothetical protein
MHNHKNKEGVSTWLNAYFFYSTVMNNKEIIYFYVSWIMGLKLYYTFIKSDNK